MDAPFGHETIGDACREVQFGRQDMARPLSTPADPYRAGSNGNYPGRFNLNEPEPNLHEELESLRNENGQLRSLCAELEQALHEAAQQPLDNGGADERLREFEELLEEKSETIRQLHQQLQDAQVALDEAQNKPGGFHQGPMPREEELLALSEDLERERRQLQEDEQALMEQMRQMEMSMARERAEMARQRNDLQRLQGEIRHELERLERNGALQSKMEELKAKFQDATNRRGAAPAGAPRPASSTTVPAIGKKPAKPQEEEEPPAPRGSFMGRLFGGK
jgi:hypothetical protein